MPPVNTSHRKAHPLSGSNIFRARAAARLLAQLVLAATMLTATVAHPAGAAGKAAPSRVVADAGLTMTSASMVSVFSNGMVLQQGSATHIFGTGSSNASFDVQLTNSSGAVLSQASGQSDANGKWLVSIPVPVGGPYTLAVIGAGGSALVSISSVHGGEVWLCSGQSNMERAISFTDVTVETAPDPQLGLFAVYGTTATSVLTDSAYRWSWFNNASPSVALDSPAPSATTMPAVSNFSALCYEFGKKLRVRLGVPVGLIQSSLGSTALEEWLPFGRIPPVQRPKGGAPLVYADAYNAMIAWLIPYTLQGVVWYQGNGNVQGILPPSQTTTTDYGAFRYLSLLPILISDWRAEWGENLAFIDIQLESSNCAINDLTFHSPYQTELREAQRLVMSATYGGAYVPSLDWGFLTTNNVHSGSTSYQGRSILNYGSTPGTKGCATSQPNALSPVPISEGFVHPPFKRVLGDRAFAQAMALVYGGPPASQSPALAVSSLSASGAVLTVQSLGSDTLGLLGGTGGVAKGFALCCGSSGQYMPASGTINDDQSITVTPNDGYALAGVAQIVRYGWTNYVASANDLAQQEVAPWSLPLANLITSAALPVLGFSSDPYMVSADIARTTTNDPARVPSVYYHVLGKLTQIVSNPSGSRDVFGWACARHHWDSLYVTLTVSQDQPTATIGPVLANVDPGDASVPSTCATTGSPALNGFDIHIPVSLANAAAGATITVTAHSPQGFGDVVLAGSGHTLP